MQEHLSPLDHVGSQASTTPAVQGSPDRAPTSPSDQKASASHYTTNDVARYLGITTGAVRTWIRKGLLAASPRTHTSRIQHIERVDFSSFIVEQPAWSRLPDMVRSQIKEHLASDHLPIGFWITSGAAQQQLKSTRTYFEQLHNLACVATWRIKNGMRLCIASEIDVIARYPRGAEGVVDAKFCANQRAAATIHSSPLFDECLACSPLTLPADDHVRYLTDDRSAQQDATSV